MYSVAVIGATGAVGREMLNILEERNFPIETLRVFASERSRGKTLTYRGEELEVEVLGEASFEGVQIALSSPGASVSRVYSPQIAEAGGIVIDNTSAFRMDPDIPLVVPEVNPEDVEKHNGIIANPNCSTIQMVVALKPLHDAATIKRLVISTYQAVSGKGTNAVKELEYQVKSYAGGKGMIVEVFPHQIAFNCLPHIDVFLENGYTKEEMKMVNETRKIMHAPEMRITATTVRVPVFTSHSESVNVETEKKLSAAQVRELLEAAPGVEVVDDPQNDLYPLPFDAAGKDATFVGRIREDESIDNGINLWIVSDNLRKGAALNTLQIAELLIEKGMLG